MMIYTFREEEAPKFKISGAGLLALLLLLLFLLVTAHTPVFQLSAEELRVLEEQRLEQEREMTFRFVDAPEDDVEHENPRFLSDANRIKKSERSEEDPENDDPISRGNTFELEQASLPSPESAAPPVARQSEPESEERAQPEDPEEPVEPEIEEPSEKPVEDPVEVAEDGDGTQNDPVRSGAVPTDPGAPKPYRKLSKSEMAQAKKMARNEMTALSLKQSRARESQYHNPRGSAAPVTGMSIETTRDDLGPYLKILKQLIKGNWRIPNIARFEVSGVAVVFFKIHKDGKFSDAQLVTTSGYEPLDTSALNAILSTYQAPPLPEHVEEEWIPIRFGFYYNMRPRY